MPNASRTSVSCLELRDLNSAAAAAYHDYVFVYHNRSPPDLPQTHQSQFQQQHEKGSDRELNHQHNQPRLSEILDVKSKSLSKYHAASLAKAARQISSRDSEKPLPKKARWLIITIGIILFGMSMLLVGVTLKLAPMIDEIVRKEHEDLLRKMNASIKSFQAFSNISLVHVGHPLGATGNSSSTDADDAYEIDEGAHSTPPPPPLPP